MALLAGCSLGDLGAPAATATLPPQPSATSTPSATASPKPSPTITLTATASATPTATLTATPSPTPTHTPTQSALVRSRQRVNVREGPGTTFPPIGSLAPGSQVQILALDEGGEWYQVRLESGEEGWISASLLSLIEPTPDADSPATPIAADISAADAGSSQEGRAAFDQPIVDMAAVQRTATALVAASALAALPDVAAATAPASPATIAATAPPPATRAIAPRLGVDVFAFCDNPGYNVPGPGVLPAGSTIEIFWAWFASSRAYLDQHISSAAHELRINGARIDNVDQFRRPPTTRGNEHVVYWYVPYGPLQAGDYRITYRVTWRAAISDGYKSYGPGSATEFEEERCSFTVR